MEMWLKLLAMGLERKDEFEKDLGGKIGRTKCLINKGEGIDDHSQIRNLGVWRKCWENTDGGTLSSLFFLSHPYDYPCYLLKY